MRLAVPSAALPHACENRHGNRRSHGYKNAREPLPGQSGAHSSGQPGNNRKAFGELLDERFGQAPGSATPPCGIGWRNVQTGIPGKLRRQEIYSPLAVFPIVQIHGKSGTASGKRTSITTGCPGFGIYLSGFLVAFLHAADRLGLLFVQVQNINHILPFFRNGAGTYSLN